jgi:hypothetical protein
MLTKRRNNLTPEKLTQLVLSYMFHAAEKEKHNLIHIMTGMDVDVKWGFRF